MTDQTFHELFPLGADETPYRPIAGDWIGNAAIGGAVFVCAMALMYAVKATGTLRVSKEGELEGLDLHEHGGLAYPELEPAMEAAAAAESADTGLAIQGKTVSP